MHEIEAQAIAAQQQINVVKAQMSSKQRDLRLLELTSNEINQVPKDTNVYEGVGKMCGLFFYFISPPSPYVNKTDELLAPGSWRHRWTA